MGSSRSGLVLCAAARGPSTKSRTTTRTMARAMTRMMTRMMTRIMLGRGPGFPKGRHGPARSRRAHLRRRQLAGRRRLSTAGLRWHVPRSRAPARMRREGDAACEAVRVGLDGG